MSIESQIERIEGNISAAYEAIAEKGGGVEGAPANSENLAASIRAIPAGGGDSLPKGAIVIWSGAADAVPDGWALCDGTNGTPDLRGRFVLGHSADYAVGATGGEVKVRLTNNELPAHAHQERGTMDGANLTGNSAIGLTINGSQQSSSVTKYRLVPSTVSNYATAIPLTTAYSGSGNAHNNMPPYYVLCYIMKLTEGGSSGGGSSGGESAGEVYSTEETRIGTWIDGKPLYRRVFSGQTNATLNQYIHFGYISDTDTDCEVVNSSGIIQSTSGTRYPMPYISGTNSVSYLISKSSDGIPNVKIKKTSEDFANVPAVVIVEYTKSTD